MSTTAEVRWEDISKPATAGEIDTIIAGKEDRFSPGVAKLVVKLADQYEQDITELRRPVEPAYVRVPTLWGRGKARRQNVVAALRACDENAYNRTCAWRIEGERVALHRLAHLGVRLILDTRSPETLEASTTIPGVLHAKKYPECGHAGRAATFVVTAERQQDGTLPPLPGEPNREVFAKRRYELLTKTGAGQERHVRASTNEITDYGQRTAVEAIGSVLCRLANLAAAEPNAFDPTGTPFEQVDAYGKTTPPAQPAAAIPPSM